MAWAMLRRVRARLLDGPYVVQLFLVLLSIGWAVVLSQPYCLTCLPTYEGLRASGGDHAWMLRLVGLAMIGAPGLVWPVMWLRVVTLALQSMAWGIITGLFMASPTPPTGLAIYPDVVLLSWWALWRMGARAR